MHRLGISVYPEHSTKEQDEAYLELAANYGFTRIFTCLLSVEEPKEVICETFTAFITKAHTLGFLVSVDTNPRVFKHLEATPYDLSVFAKMGVDIVRLDGHFSDLEDLAITHNPYNLKIEFNGSAHTALGLMLQRGANKDNMVVCHNFYPQRYTGLSWDTFMQFTNEYKALGFPLGAFVSSNQPATFGPWPVYAGLPTCEMHRGLPIDFQVRHLLATNKIDDIIIGNAYASEAELKAMSQIDLTKTTFAIELEPNISEDELKIVFEYQHFNRQDASDYMIRSVVSKLAYTATSIPVKPCDKQVFERGDVVIVNDELAHYRGELHIMLRDIPNTGDKNYVGKLTTLDLAILPLLKTEHLFGFQCKDEATV